MVPWGHQGSKGRGRTGGVGGERGLVKHGVGVRGEGRGGDRGGV